MSPSSSPGDTHHSKTSPRDRDPQASERRMRSAALRAHFVSEKEVKRGRKEKRKKKWAAACLGAQGADPIQSAKSSHASRPAIADPSQPASRATELT